MKYRYSKYVGDPLDELDLEDLVAKLSDLLLASGFGNPYGMDDEERTMQALHDAILDALFNGGVLPDETLERLLGERPAARALSAPGMPAGSPGMEAAGREPYATVLILNDGSTRVFGRHNGA